VPLSVNQRFPHMSFLRFNLPPTAKNCAAAYTVQPFSPV
jgi:hypothetical protein